MIEPLKYKRQSRVVKKLNELIDYINKSNLPPIVYQPTLDTKQEKCPDYGKVCEHCGKAAYKVTGTMGEGKE